jgi:hypothetical protein
VAAALLNQFRGSVWREPTYAEFELRQMPRHGEERIFHGRFWGTRNDLGPVTRFEIDAAPASPARHLLIQGGRDPQVWTSGGAGPGILGQGNLLVPIIPGVEVTPFDLLPMPYLYWIDSDFTGTETVRGRQANVYVLTPSADFHADYPAIKAVRVYLDAQYDALEESETLGMDGRVAKTLTLLELRKVGPRWIPKDVDVRNEGTRDKTRLSLTAIGVGVDMNPAAFDPTLLGTAIAPPTGDIVIRITQ